MTIDLNSSRAFSATAIAQASMPFQDVLDAIPAGALAVDPHGEIAAVNQELLGLFGYRADDLIGESVDVLVPGPQRQDHFTHRTRSLQISHARLMGQGAMLHGQRKDGSIFPVEVGLRGLPFPGNFVLAVVSDRSEQVRAAASEAQGEMLAHELTHQQVLAREMGHRVKNLLTTVSALITLTARAAKTPKAMEESLRGRLMALSSVIDLSLHSSSFGSDATMSVEDVLRAVLAPFMWTSAESDRISLRGAEMQIGGRAAEVFALVFHELATNAFKYGALGHSDGKVEVTWELADDHAVITWREQAAQFVTVSPSSPGFGMTLMQRLIDMEFSGRTERQVSDLGWTTRIIIPTAALGTPREQS